MRDEEGSKTVSDEKTSELESCPLSGGRCPLERPHLRLTNRVHTIGEAVKVHDKTLFGGERPGLEEVSTRMTERMGLVIGLLKIVAVASIAAAVASITVAVANAGGT
jgi:hypothetical protein